MSYAPPSIGSAGLSAPAYLDIQQWLVTNFLAIYGASSYLGPDSADFQDIAIRALQAFDANNGLQALYAAMSIQTAVGPNLDLLGQNQGVPRKAATYSTATVTLTGSPFATITNGVVQDTSSNLWSLPSSVSLHFAGTASVLATCQVLGNVTAQPNTITSIYTPTAGWTSVSNPAAATPGAAVEADSAYRARLTISQALPSSTLVAGTAAALAAIPGVGRTLVVENPTNSGDSFGNPPHSITCIVEFGDPPIIASAIYNNKGIGCYTNGGFSFVVTDPSNSGLSQTVRWYYLQPFPFYVAMNITGYSAYGYVSTTTTQIQTAIVNYLNALAVNAPVVYGELYAAALSVRPNPEIPMFSITSLSFGTPTAVCNVTTTAFSNVLTSIAPAETAAISIGQTIVCPGVPNGATVTAVGSTTVTMSVNASASATPTAAFFTLATPGSSVAPPFAFAAQGVPNYVVLTVTLA